MTTLATTTKKTIEVKTGKNYMLINIELPSEKHNYFAITADFYEPLSGKNTYDESEIYRNNKTYIMTAGGCMHENILSAKPELKPFIDLHLSDNLGRPMYYIENGYYHFTRDLKVFADYMRISFNDAKELRGKVFDKNEFIDWANTKVNDWANDASNARELFNTI